MLVVSLIFAGLTSGLVLGIRFHEKIRSFIYAVNRRFPGHVTAFAREKATLFLDGLLLLGALPRMLGAITATAMIWSIEIVSYYFFGLAVWGAMNVRAAVLFLVVVNFTSLIPLTMGGIGTIEAVAPLFLISSGISAPLALAHGPVAACITVLFYNDHRWDSLPDRWLPPNTTRWLQNCGS